MRLLVLASMSPPHTVKTARIDGRAATRSRKLAQRASRSLELK